MLNDGYILTKLRDVNFLSMGNYSKEE